MGLKTDCLRLDYCQAYFLFLGESHEILKFQAFEVELDFC